MQEHRNAGAIAKDKNIIAVYKLERDYKLGVIPKPLDPNGKPYEDPLTDPHISAARALHPEVARLVKEEPWLANKKHPLVAEYRQKGKILNYCVPMTSQALTKTGWKFYNELVIGEEILAFDTTAKRTKWAPITNLTKIDKQLTYRIRGESWEAVSTANHRWFGRKLTKSEAKGSPFKQRVQHNIKYRDKWFTTDTVQSNFSIRISAELENNNSPITADEAELLTYLILSGNNYVLKFKDISRTRYLMALTKAVKGRLETSDELSYIFLDVDEVNRITRKARLDSAYNWHEFLFSLSSEGRMGFLRAFMYSEGYYAENIEPSLHPQEDEILDLLITANYLEGFQSKLYTGKKGYLTSPGLYMKKVVATWKQHIRCQSMRPIPVKEEDVWCPTTKFGTWVMRQGNHISITGNCLIYGGQASSIANQLKCSVDEAQEMIDAYFAPPDGFYGLGTWLKSTAAIAAERRWVQTALGAILFANESNAKGLADVNTVMRKACNSAVTLLINYN